MILDSAEFRVLSTIVFGLVAPFERWIVCSLLKHCLQQKTLWQLTEHGVSEEGGGMHQSIIHHSVFVSATPLMHI